jgi:hypothetical protein
VGPITGLDEEERRKILPLAGLELRPLSCPARSQSLYRLSYPRSQNYIGVAIYCIISEICVFPSHTELPQHYL